jgi:hypothetical protein
MGSAKEIAASPPSAEFAAQANATEELYREAEHDRAEVPP